MVRNTDAGSLEVGFETWMLKQCDVEADFENAKIWSDSD